MNTSSPSSKHLGKPSENDPEKKTAPGKNQNSFPATAKLAQKNSYLSVNSMDRVDVTYAPRRVRQPVLHGMDQRVQEEISRFAKDQSTKTASQSVSQLAGFRRALMHPRST